MKTDLQLQDSYRRADGAIGCRAEVVITGQADGWHGFYSFDTHGLTAPQVLAKARTFKAYHEAKAARLTGFRSVQGSEVTVGGATFRVVDCTIFDQDVTLYLDVRKIVNDVQTTVPGFPLRRKYFSMDQIPTDQEITAIVTAALPQSQTAVATAHSALSAAVAAAFDQDGSL